jgi:hypothetical protein
MTKERCIRRLRGYSLLSQFASLLVFAIGVVSIILFIDPSIFGVASNSILAYRDRWIWALFGLVFISLGIFFNIIAYRWPRILLRILHTQPSSPMRFQLKYKQGNGNSQYYAYLTEPSPGSHTPTWCIGLWAVSREIDKWLDRVCSAKVYRDPKTGTPAIIELEDMYLWAMKGDAKQV